jgi:hypothetical protein
VSTSAVATSRASSAGFQKSMLSTSVPTRIDGAASYAAIKDGKMPPDVPKWSITVTTS